MANKVSVISLGCPKNMVDSDNLTRKLISNGFLYLNAPEDADILLINTCGFIEDAKKESIEEILKLAKIKKGAKKLIVFGCLAKRYKDEILKEIPEIDAIFGVGEDEKIVEYCEKIKGSKGQGVKLKNNSSTRILAPSQSSYAYLKIADGCNKKCSYCVIPSIRGKYKSLMPDEIIKEAERLVKADIKELILVAQDTACYGKDLNPPEADNIASLLKDLCSLKGDFWIRLLYAYPASISESLLKVIAEEDKICKYLDIPFQHSEDRILKLMKRGGARKGYLNLIRKIRSIIPDIVLRTTFIIGFPSETEKEFNSLLDFIDEVKFDRLGVFKYSREEGTPAAKLKGQISDIIKNRRVNEIMKHQAYISLDENKKLIGRQFKALIDEVTNGIAIGRLYSHAPEIDGVVIIDDCRMRNTDNAPSYPPLKIRGGRGSYEIQNPKSEILKTGSFVTVKITEAFEYDLKGIIA
ncbi:MAG: 30S ribosomal protein S12 methylthiotransferase RimO [Thermodesulfovibrionales bacterium]|nr:30S ribosomal protein S12 methylthiotransferase RimO [Thermodesulfovibrionales bacterium]MDP3110917.1 30S ribosomal protein S12 methylthiotransferase RimO [Thermodesulfovibrionales bacterium]